MARNQRQTDPYDRSSLGDWARTIGVLAGLAGLIVAPELVYRLGLLPWREMMIWHQSLIMLMIILVYLRQP